MVTSAGKKMNEFGYDRLLTIDKKRTKITVDYFPDRKIYSIVERRGVHTMCPTIDQDQAIALVGALQAHINGFDFTTKKGEIDEVKPDSCVGCEKICPHDSGIPCLDVDNGKIQMLNEVLKDTGYKFNSMGYLVGR